jgi:FkbH-like protein
MEALEHHPGMLLKPLHFSALRINWRDKASNLREIAEELNVGLDALAFVDDNPVERQQVRDELPAVHVLDLPVDPGQFARALRRAPVFERLTLSSEDSRRAAMYESQRERRQLMHDMSSRDDFLRSLQQQAEISPVTPATLTRVAQLTNKTNQFNLTTRRYSEQQIRDLVASPGWDCFSIRVRDRFGDNGLVGVAITRTVDASCEIDTLLLSCRVIGRSIETAFLSFLADHARRRGAAEMRGWFYPTKKNAPASEFYRDHRFALIDRRDEATLWGLDLADRRLACPEWIAVHFANGVER